MNDKDKKSRFFQKTFLPAEISMDIAFKMLFITLYNAEVNFINEKLGWRLYIAMKNFFTIRLIELVRKKKCAIVTLNLEDEIFVINIASLAIFNTNAIHPFHKAQIA